MGWWGGAVGERTQILPLCMGGSHHRPPPTRNEAVGLWEPSREVCVPGSGQKGAQKGPPHTPPR